jgi:hypothetical protein
MKTFYLYRREDLHGHSGLGVVAEGVIFDNGMACMTWLSEWATMTMFPNIQTVARLHSHEGRTLVVVEGRKKDAKLFLQCREAARTKASVAKAKKEHGNIVDKKN